MVRVSALRFLAFAVASFVGSSSAEDSLYSRRLSKRFIDSDGNYNISFYHVNDVHAHLDEFSSSGTDCTSPEKGCYGGYARIKTVIEDTRPEHQDSLWLNVGDEFQGTLFYTFYGGEKIADTLNQMGFDAMTLGNHEFDGGDEPLGDFLKNLTFPIISANIVSDNEKLNSTIKPYHIFEEYQLAVIGVTTETTSGISNPGDGTKFTDAIAAVQASIDEIRSTTNITRIAAITHIGYEVDKRLAQETTGLQLIIGGHSHTLLGDMEGAEGKYPTIETNKDGDEVFIVTAYRWGEYLGYIDVTYDPDGKILAYHGAPIHLTNTTEQDEDLQEQIDEWRVPFEAFAAQQVGSTNVVLDQSTCQKQECALGDLVSDALLQYRVDGGSDAAFALVNAGGIRATIDAGPITRGQVLTSFPFGNAVVEVTYSGADLWKIFEGLASGINQFNQEEITSFFQISRGIKVEYNPDNAVGSRLVRLTIGDAPVDQAAEYKVVTVDFITGGGDNILEPVDDVISLDTMEEVLVEYIQKASPIDFQLDGRIATVQGSANESSTSANGTDTSGAGHVSGISSSVVLPFFTTLLAFIIS
ncbi:Metallo-dependent phosphatase [Hypoxylon rubiginosum]|uniref:Metallo-dependent phosphatase n=1 Tax=Hypoxylon rubiginosum TaxID=110542 RepID=A0ACB9YUP3_9PEZI|nr:Metallo-dependent phosphatase [Hypoxylon rubiginosum]